MDKLSKKKRQHISDVESQIGPKQYLMKRYDVGFPLYTVITTYDSETALDF